MKIKFEKHSDFKYSLLENSSDSSRWTYFFKEARMDNPSGGSNLGIWKNFGNDRYSDIWLYIKTECRQGIASNLLDPVEIPIHQYLYDRLGTPEEIRIARGW